MSSLNYSLYVHATEAASNPRPSLEGLNLPASARLAFGLLAKLSHGQLSVHLPKHFGLNEPLVFGALDKHCPSADSTSAHKISATLYLNNWNVFEQSFKNGDVGFAQTWIDADWSTPNLLDLLRLLVANRKDIEQVVYGNWVGRLALRVKHLLNRNTRHGSRRNIHAHYDLGNAFYGLWLDPSMTYSSALFRELPVEHAFLEAAQKQKYQRMLDELELKTPASILEIGCGWGGFADLALGAGHHVKGLTLSTEQREFARARLREPGRAAQADIALQDYRDENGRFDAVVSIEMFEAVGESYWPSYFKTLKRCLKPGARAVVQTITIADELFDRYRVGSDFIQQYIFPGGMLPSVARFTELASTHGLKLVNQHAFGQDYAHTLRLWRESFMSKLEQVRPLGFDDRFIRTWEFYLAYCQAAFEANNTDVVQFTLQAE